MSQSYDRRINLYINIDGKEVKNNVASIRAEMNKLVNEQARMTIGSKEYAAQTQKIKQLKGILDKHRQDVSEVGNSWNMKKMADGFNRYFTMITAFFAAFAGVALTVKSAIQAYNEYDDKLADVMKTTGLTKDETIELSNELKKIDTRTTQQGLLDLARVAGKLGITGTADILGFVRAADKINVALSEDLGGNAEEAINQLGKLVDIFNLKDQYGMELSLLKIGSAINSLGAAGTANEGYLVEFAKRVAGIAPSAGISVQNILGLATTLDELGQTAEVSGTVYNSVIAAMFKDTAKYAGMAKMPLSDFTKLLNTDANEAFIKVLEGAKGSGNGFAEMAINLDQLGLDGARSTGVLGVLADNIDKLREKQALSNAEFEKGTSLTNEFNTKNDTAQAKLEKAKKGFVDLTVQLGEQLTPAYTRVVGRAGLLLEVISGTINFLFRYSGTIVTVVASITAYTIATKLATLWETRNNAQKGIGLALSKLQTLAYHAQFAAVSLYNVGLALLKGNLAAASVQARAFTAALMANPVGLIIGGIVAMGTALYFYTAKLTGAQKAQVMMNDINRQAQKNIVEEKIKIQSLLDLARNEKLTKEERISAINQINALSPKMLGFLTLENIKTKEATEATEAYTESLFQNAKAQAAKDKMAEIDKELLDLQMGEGAEVSFWQMAGNAVTSYGNSAVMAGKNAASAAKNLTEREAELNLQREKLLGITQKQAAEELKNSLAKGGSDNAPQDLIKLKEKELQAVNDRIAVTPAEIAARNKAAESIEKEIARLKELGTTKGKKTLFDQQKEDAAKAIAILDETNNERIAKLTIQYEREGWTDERFKAEQLSAELASLTLKKAMLEQFGQSTIQTEAQISQKRIEMQKSLNDALADSEKQAIEDLTESAKIDEQAIQASIEASDKVLESVKKQKDDEKQVLKERQQAYLQFALAVGQSFGDLMADQEASLGDYLRNTILMALDAFHQWFLIEKMKTIIQGISGGFVGAAIAIAKVAAMEVAYQGVRAAVANSGKSRTQGRAIGGFMDGEQTYTVAEKGREWIAPNWLLTNPIAAPIIAGLESWRQNPISISQGAIQASQQTRSNTSVTRPPSYKNDNSVQVISQDKQPTLSNDHLSRLNQILDRLESKEFSISVEAYERMRESVEKTKQSGLG